MVACRILSSILLIDYMFTALVLNMFQNGINLQELNINISYTPQKNLRTSTYLFPLFNTESLIFKIENIF